MTRSICLVVTAFVFCVSGCQKVELKEFSPDGTFKVMMPEKKQESNQDFSGFPAKIWISEFNDGALAVLVMDMKSAGALVQVMSGKLLKDAQDKTVESLKGKIVSESEAKLDDKYPGRVFEATAKVPSNKGGEIDGIMKGSLYTAEGKVFMVYALGKPDWMKQQVVTEFLSSLKITK